MTFRKDIGSTASDIKEIMLTALRTVIQTVINMDRENPLVGNLVSVMLSIFRFVLKLSEIVFKLLVIEKKQMHMMF